MDKARSKKNAIKIGLDVAAILALGIGSIAATEFLPILQDLEVFVAVAAGIWGYIPLRDLIEKFRK